MIAYAIVKKNTKKLNALEIYASSDVVVNSDEIMLRVEIKVLDTFQPHKNAYK